MGCPDLSLLPELSDIFQVGLDQLLTGELDAREALGGNMKKTAFYICPDCGNVAAVMADAAVSCCGRRLEAAQLGQRAGYDAHSAARNVQPGGSATVQRAYRLAEEGGTMTYTVSEFLSHTKNAVVKEFVLDGPGR